MMDWNMITAISTAFMASVIFLTAIFAAYQLKEIKKSRNFAAFMSLCQLIQREDVRTARGILFKTSEEKKFEEWSENEIKEAEKACWTYDFLAMMIFADLMEKDLSDFIVNSWQRQIIKTWKAAEPMIHKYQDERGKDFWGSFEKLYKKAKNIETSYNRG